MLRRMGPRKKPWNLNPQSSVGASDSPSVLLLSAAYDVVWGDRPSSAACPPRLRWGLAAAGSGFAAAGAGAAAGVGAVGSSAGAAAAGAGAASAGVAGAGTSSTEVGAAGGGGVSSLLAAGVLDWVFFLAAEAVPPDASRAATRKAAESRRRAIRVLGRLVVVI